MDSIKKVSEYGVSSGLKQSAKGITYQLKLIMLFFVRAIARNDTFLLGTEVDGAGKFDDVVFTYKNEEKNKQETILLQAKHKSNESKKITIDDLLSGKENGDFYLPKYYQSWYEIKESFKNVKCLIICTNLDFADETKVPRKESINITEVVSHDFSYLTDYMELFHCECEDKKTAVYRLDEGAGEELFSRLWESSDAYKLCMELCINLCSGGTLGLRSEIVKRYQGPLVNKVLDVHKGKANFRINFQCGLLPEVKHFRDTLKTCMQHHNEFCKLKNDVCKLSDFESALKLQFKVSNNFGDTKNTNSDLPHDTVDRKDFGQFIDILLFAVNQPSETQLDIILAKELEKVIQCNPIDIAYALLHSTLLDWFKNKRGEYLNLHKGKEIIDEIKANVNNLKCLGICSDYKQKLKRCHFTHATDDEACDGLIKFLDNRNRTEQRVLRLEVENTVIGVAFILQFLNTIEKFENEDSFIFLKTSSLQLPNIRDTVIASLQKSDAHSLLLLECDTYQSEDLRDTLARVVEHTGAQVVLVAPHNSLPPALEGHTILQLQKNYDFTDLTLDSQNILLSIKVTFQGRSVIFSELFCNRKLYKTIDCDTFVKLILGTDLKFEGKLIPSKGYSPELYIERSLLQNVKINKTVLFDKHFGDLIALSDISMSNFLKLFNAVTIMDTEIDPTKIYSFFSKNSNIENRNTIKFYLLDVKSNEDEDFNKICELNNHSNIHWVKNTNTNNSLIWVKTHGSIKSLHKYRFKQAEGEQIAEEEILAYPIPYTIIVSSEAGAGKSHFLTHLAITMKERRNNYLVIYVDLNSNSPSFSEELTLRTEKKEPSFSHLDINKAVRFLTDKLLDNNLYSAVFKILLEHFLLKKSKNIVIFLDGFDEISPDYTDIVNELMRALQKCEVGLVLTTRPNMRQYTEESLGIFSHTLSPLSNEEKLKFVTKFRKLNINNTQMSMNKDFRKLFNSLIKQILPSEIYQSLCGIPLYLRMVLEIVLNNVTELQFECVSFGSKMTINSLFKIFVEEKFLSVFKKSKMVLESVASKQVISEKRATFYEIHQSLALHALLDEHANIFLSLKERRKVEEYISGLLKGIKGEGLVTAVVNNRPNFIHRSFAEFFAAMYFSELLKDRSENEEQRNIFLYQVLTNDNFALTRKYFDCEYIDSEIMYFFHNNYDPNLCYNILMNSVIEGTCRILNNALRWLGMHTDAVQKAFVIEDCSTGESLLGMAIRFEQLGSLGLLIEHGADINKPATIHDDVVYYPLHCAATVKWKEGCHFLIDNNADLEIPNSRKENILHFSILYDGDFETIEKIILKRVNISSIPGPFRLFPLHIAIFKKRYDVIDLLLKNISDTNSKNILNCSVFQMSLDRELKLRTIKKIASLGADIDHINYKGDTPLMIAASLNRLDVVSWLVDSGSNINQTNNITGDTALNKSICSKVKLKTIEKLVSLGADVHVKNVEGLNSLFIAVLFNRVDVIDYFLDTGCEVNEKDKYGMNILFFCIIQGIDLKTFCRLIASGCSTDIRTPTGATLLHMAIKLNRAEIIDYLSQLGDAMNEYDEDGDTAIFYCILFDTSLDMIQKLFKRGGDINHRNNAGINPYYLAREKERHDIVDWLVQSGCEMVGINNNAFWSCIIV